MTCDTYGVKYIYWLATVEAELRADGGVIAP
jgi:hypothetical protein